MLLILSTQIFPELLN